MPASRPTPPPSSAPDPAAAAAYAGFRAADTAGDPVALLRAAEPYFDAGCAAGEIPPLTLDAADLPLAPEDTRQRLLAVRERLARLGYDVPAALPDFSDTPPSAANERRWALLRPAFTAFQADALLAPTGELTAAHWDALQALFNFETPLRAARWFDAAGRPCPALARATALRLQVLGCGPSPTVRAPEPLPAALARFAAVAHDLGLVDAPLAPALTPAFAEVLFDFDRIVDALALCAPRLAALTGAAADRARAFLVCVSKVELWLNGYDVRPDGDADLSPVLVMHGPKRAGGSVSRRHAAVIELARFRADLADDFGALDATRAPAVTERNFADVAPAVLAQARVVRRAAEGGPRAQSSGEIVAQLQARLLEEPTLWDTLRTTAARLVSSLYDGVRRVISWVGRLLARGRDLVVDALRAAGTAAVNLWRAVYHFMGGAAFHFRRALRAFAAGVAFFFDGDHESRPAGGARYGRRADFDAAMVADTACTEAILGELAGRVTHGARAFAIACKIVALVTRALRTAVVATAGSFAGFVPLILGLASLWSQLRELGPLLDALGG